MAEREQGTNGHGANGHGANGHGANGHGANGHGANGHGADGHGANGHGRHGQGTAWDHVGDADATGADICGAEGCGPDGCGTDCVTDVCALGVSFPAPPAEVREHADACVRYVEQVTGVRLDYSAETLPLLDHYLELRRSELKNQPEAMGLIIRVAGAYFGEVARRRIGGFWRAEDSDILGWEVCAEPVYLSFNPFAVAYDAVHHGDEGGPTSRFELDDEDREAVEARLLELPPLSEEEFYLLSTRLEVLDIAVDAVKARMLSAGLGEVTFGPDDYERQA